MAAFVYVSGKSPVLAARWLDAEARGEPVCLLADSNDARMARTLAERYAVGAEVRILPKQNEPSDPALAAMVAAAGHAQVVLPISWETTPLRFTEGVHAPELIAYYPLFQRLWRAGFREFRTYNLSGHQVLRVPLLLDAFRGQYTGRRCFVVGNGPSLNRIDMTRLKDEITFGANRCYLGFEKWGFPFTYWAVMDWLQMEEYGAEYECSLPPGIPAFFPFEYLPWLRFPNGCPVDFRYRNHLHFSDTGEALGFGHTVIYALLQIAASMGCDPIILIGVDHRYNLKPLSFWHNAKRHLRNELIRPFRGTPLYKAARVWRQARDEARIGLTVRPRVFWQAGDAAAETHFHSEYAAGGQKRFLLPALAESEQEYRFAARWARQKDVRILNATPDSALRAFPMTDFAGLF